MMRCIREPLDRASLALTALLMCVGATTACTACTPPGPDQPGSSGASRTQASAERKRKELPTPPADQMIREAPGVDLSALGETQLASFYTMINTEPSACAKPHALATSLNDDPDCRNSLLVAQFIADRLASGATPSDIKFEIDVVAEALEVHDIPIEGRPIYGNERAPVTLVMFADFQCPHCRAEAPEVRKIVKQYRGQARLVYMHYPLGKFPRSEAAAAAAEAAHLQGKFWEMHDLIFDHQSALEDEDLERYASQIQGLDVDKWKADYASEAMELVVAKNKALGEALDIHATPSVFVNGRRRVPQLWGGRLESWIDDALKR